MTRAALNLRAGPGTDYPALADLFPGDRFVVQARNPAQDWLFVEAGGKRGWLAANLVTVSGDLAALPQASPAQTAPTHASVRATPAAPAG